MKVTPQQQAAGISRHPCLYSCFSSEFSCTVLCYSVQARRRDVASGKADLSLNLPLTSMRTSLVSLSVAADDLVFTVNRSPARVVSAEVGPGCAPVRSPGCGVCVCEGGEVSGGCWQQKCAWATSTDYNPSGQHMNSI